MAFAPSPIHYPHLSPTFPPCAFLDFEALAASKRTHVATLIARLETSFPKSLEEARTLVATLDGCSQWFQGGTKELKLAVPMFERLESNLETLVEYVQVSDSMVELSGRVPPSSHGQDFAADLRNIVAQFRERQQRWGTSLPTVRNRKDAMERRRCEERGPGFLVDHCCT